MIEKTATITSTAIDVTGIEGIIAITTATSELPLKAEGLLKDEEFL